MIEPLSDRTLVQAVVRQGNVASDSRFFGKQAGREINGEAVEPVSSLQPSASDRGQAPTPRPLR